MRRVISRIEICMLAVSFFWLGAFCAGARFPVAEQLVCNAAAAISDATNGEKTEQYLREKLPVLLRELSDFKKYLPSMGK